MRSAGKSYKSRAAQQELFSELLSVHAWRVLLCSIVGAASVTARASRRKPPQLTRFVHFPNLTQEAAN